MKTRLEFFLAILQESPELMKLVFCAEIVLVLVEITRINHVQFDSIRRFIEFWVLTKLAWKCLKVIDRGVIL